MLALTNNRIILLLLINFILLVVGCILDSIAAITIMTPVLIMSIAFSLGLDPVQFGVMMVLNLMIGWLTPPLGMVLYVLSTVSKVPFEKSVKGTAPFLIPLIVVLLMITFIPWISTVPL